MTPGYKILVLGATGYIGGSILTEFLSNKDAPKYTLSALVRQETQAEKLKEAGVNALLFKGLDDIDAVRDAAKDHDVVVAAASARHAECAKACIAGLGERARKTQRKTSGTSMLNDWPVTGERIDESFHSDVNEDIYALEKNHKETYSAVRKVNQVVVEAGEMEGVRTYIVAPPLIFGKGTGMFNVSSGQIEMMAELSFKQKQAVVIGEGKGIWSRVHIRDLANLYLLLATAISGPSTSEIPHGKTGYYFAENGYQTWLDISEGIGKAGKAQDAFGTAEVKSIGLQEAAEFRFEGSTREAESILASKNEPSGLLLKKTRTDQKGYSSRTKADKARQVLGWRPKYMHEEYLMDIEDIVGEEAAKAKLKGS